ncbi:hypothetical protein BGI41_04125 [Methanobrevibacter sp. 87.7]|uniref:DUF2097 domain-containing protein n=1 Tax=Methanobrevibacter sp. 87.7 TaxID=387957 RepID=UPI000B50A27E|nr:DUF2097 domain-containing protein [Methanobrevibacter sp. 87.7]OWT33103.1 hypothetical protein BGI41_04125 [Methanobrevibacter sp. 87.7]
MEKEIKMTPDEAVEYIRNNVNVGDTLELSYNRIFAPGEVLGVVSEDSETGEGLRVNLQLNGDILNQNIEVDFKEIKDEIVEIRHITDEDDITIEFY